MVTAEIEYRTGLAGHDDRNVSAGLEYRRWLAVINEQSAQVAHAIEEAVENLVATSLCYSVFVAQTGAEMLLCVCGGNSAQAEVTKSRYPPLPAHKGEQPALVAGFLLFGWPSNCNKLRARHKAPPEEVKANGPRQ